MVDSWFDPVCLYQTCLSHDRPCLTLSTLYDSWFVEVRPAIGPCSTRSTVFDSWFDHVRIMIRLWSNIACLFDSSNLRRKLDIVWQIRSNHEWKTSAREWSSSSKFVHGSNLFKNSLQIYETELLSNCFGTDLVAKLFWIPFLHSAFFIVKWNFSRSFFLSMHSIITTVTSTNRTTTPQTDKAQAVFVSRTIMPHPRFELLSMWVMRHVGPQIMPTKPTKRIPKTKCQLSGFLNYSYDIFDEMK